MCVCVYGCAGCLALMYDCVRVSSGQDQVMSEFAWCVYSLRCWAPLAFTPAANQLLSEPASIPTGGRSTGVIVLAKTNSDPLHDF